MGRRKIKKRKGKGGKAGRFDPRVRPLLDHLGKVEAELRALGWWRSDTIDPFAHLPEDEPRNYTNASSFEEWLQFVFLPNARGAARGGTLPTESNVGQMAQHQYESHEHIAQAQPLIGLLSEFDDMVDRYHARQGGAR